MITKNRLEANYEDMLDDGYDFELSEEDKKEIIKMSKHTKLQSGRYLIKTYLKNKGTILKTKTEQELIELLNGIG